MAGAARVVRRQIAPAEPGGREQRNVGISEITAQFGELFSTFEPGAPGSAVSRLKEASPPLRIISTISACPRPNLTLALTLSKMVGLLARDVVLTREEVDGLLADLLVTGSTPTGATKLSEWLRANSASIGRRYQSELARHYRASGR